MKLIYIPIIIISIIYPIIGAELSDCRNSSPNDLAKHFFEIHNNFYCKDPNQFRDAISPRFFAALEKEYRCISIPEVCAIEAVPWIAAQDGEIGGPIRFKTLYESDTKADVEINYKLVLTPDRSWERSSTLHFIRQDKNSCWIISDITMPEIGSFVEMIERWHKEYGESE